MSQHDDDFDPATSWVAQLLAGPLRPPAAPTASTHGEGAPTPALEGEIALEERTERARAIFTGTVEETYNERISGRDWLRKVYRRCPDLLAKFDEIDRREREEVAAPPAETNIPLFDYAAICCTIRILEDRGDKNKKLNKVRAAMYDDLEPGDQAEAQQIEKRNGLWCFHAGRVWLTSDFGVLREREE